MPSASLAIRGSRSDEVYISVLKTWPFMMIEIGPENENISDYLGHLLRHGDHGWSSQAGAAKLEASSKRLFSKTDFVSLLELQL